MICENYLCKILFTHNTKSLIISMLGKFCIFANDLHFRLNDVNLINFNASLREAFNFAVAVNTNTVINT